MAKQIKTFVGNTPPVLEKGELANNGRLLYLGTGNGKYVSYEEAFDNTVNGVINGIPFNADKSGFIMPSDITFSKLKEFLYALPKNLLDGNSVLQLYFPVGSTIVNDLGSSFFIPKVNYAIAFKAESGALAKELDQPVTFDFCDYTFGIRGDVRFSGIKLIATGTTGGWGFFESQAGASVSFSKCSFEGDLPIMVVWGGFVEIGDCYFKLPNQRLIHGCGGIIKMYRNLSDSANPPLKITQFLGGTLQVGSDYSDLYCQEDPQFYSVTGGLFIKGNQTLD